MYKVKAIVGDKELNYEFRDFWQVKLFVYVANFMVRLLWGGLTPDAPDGATCAHENWTEVDGQYYCYDCKSVIPAPPVI